MIVNPYFNSEKNSFKKYEKEAPPSKSVDELLIGYVTRKRLDDLRSKGETVTPETEILVKKMATSALYNVLGITS